MNGPERLSWPDIEAWTRMSGLPLTPDEADAVMAMSAAFCRGCREDKAPREPLACQIALASAEMSAY